MTELLKSENKVGLLVLMAFVGVTIFVFYWRVSIEEVPGDYYVKQGNYRLEDGQYEQAVATFQQALQQNPSHALAHLGQALAYMQLRRNADALEAFNRAIEHDASLAVAYADRGILHDRMGAYDLAIDDYRQALVLNPKLARGPGWLWRFLHNVPDKPSTIADRLAYLQGELGKPPDKRLLRVPERDRQQRMHPY